MRPASGNDLKTVLLHRTAFLCVSRFLRLASFGTVNALMIAISVTFQPLFSVIPKIYSNIDHLQIENKRILLKIHKPFKLYIPEGDLHYYQLNIHSSIYGEENLKKIIAINKENKA